MKQSLEKNLGIGNDLRRELEADFKMSFADKSIIIAQVEIVNAKEFLNEYQAKITSILKTIKQERNLNYIFLNCVDILNGYSIIYTIDSETESFLNSLLQIDFINRKCTINKVIQRKEIVRKIKEQYL